MGSAHVADPVAPVRDAGDIDLGIDTAADDASLALLRGDEVVAQCAWHVDSTMSKELLAHLDALLVEAGVMRQQIASIAVTNGPGTYGAVRTGLATAQGLALALDVPLAGIGRFEADALLHLAPGRVVVATHDTGRAGIAWAAYTQDAPGEAPRCLVAPDIATAEDVVRLAPSPATWCGETNEALRSALQAARDSARRSGDTDAHNSEDGSPAGGRAAALVRIARARQAYGDPALVDAFYLRPPSITRAGTRAKPHEA